MLAQTSGVVDIDFYIRIWVGNSTSGPVPILIFTHLNNYVFNLLEWMVISSCTSTWHFENIPDPT